MKNVQYSGNFKSKISLLFFLLLNLFLISHAQEVAEEQITAAEKSAVADSISKYMTDYYVFPEVGNEMGTLITDNLKNGNYNDITSYQEFSIALSNDLQSVNHDRHIGVRYNPEMIALMKKAEADSTNTEFADQQEKSAALENYYFKEIRILAGNVGYLKFNRFVDASLAGPTAVAAMNFLANTSALIIDLRENGGGSPSLIQLITSYFFEEPQHLNSFYIREGEQTHQFWTLPYVPGKKLVNAELFILTSSYTFSGAEEFTYNLKNMERATVVGETTGGGAHPVSTHIINDNFTINIPFGRAINPLTKTNWEGTGIEPHIKTTRAEAFDRAYLLALEKLLKETSDDETKYTLSWAYEGLNAQLNPVVLDEKTMKGYVGNYGPRKITMENGMLFYQREDRPPMKMIPMSENMFRFDEIDYFRLRIILEAGEATAVEGHYDNGRNDRNEKS